MCLCIFTFYVIIACTPSKWVHPTKCIKLVCGNFCASNFEQLEIVLVWWWGGQEEGCRGRRKNINGQAVYESWSLFISLLLGDVRILRKFEWVGCPNFGALGDTMGGLDQNIFGPKCIQGIIFSVKGINKSIESCWLI